MECVHNPQVVGQRAEAYFRRGIPCTQSLLLALHEPGAGEDDPVVRAAAALGRGLSVTGSLCGLVAAGMLAIGHARSTGTALTPHPAPQHDWLDFYRPGVEQEDVVFLCREFYTQLAERAVPRYGSLICREIGGVDWSCSPEVLRYYGADGGFPRCAELVGTAAELLAKLLRPRPEAT